jgi:hypothetical protein
MALRVKLYTIENKATTLEYQSPLPARTDDTLATFRTFLEGEGLVDFPFDFWIPNDKKRCLHKFERFNALECFGGRGLRH